MLRALCKVILNCQYITSYYKLIPCSPVSEEGAKAMSDELRPTTRHVLGPLSDCVPVKDLLAVPGGQNI